ncbi:glutathione S-transferase family protein [Sneathiella sp. HT1-7]|uniref:glutathione S-transferase family protein n=1 Tax=Sneathiella sp. HT1-7 TaxID=2887192 RepID=UPI001D14523F|nr:glutathione S-transferase family protein [Sneathiella sp. HT1-7]MCC3304023.1 glutathione S-transferase family protein [Sneathiella sp. HT1-7]
MIDLYTWGTPNGRKVSILLEELGLPYEVKPIDITAGDQKTPEFLAISPNGRIPAIVDHDTGVRMMESGAIMLYLAKKAGGKLIPSDDVGYWQMMEWLMWQMGGLGPMAGQTHHFVRFNPGKAPYAEERYLNEVKRLYGVLDTALSERDYVAGEYSVADIAIWPWISRFEWQTIDLNQYPNVKDWYNRIAGRPAVQKGYHIPHYVSDVPVPE